ncbi:2-amino-4-hydroxy-6-hydroxymethyldihydropteridine diphosphokinase [Malaciobacter molluscorum LMG 25693]|uniref:2-amino-4-hydroxy-6-hydroxymethyldihydropteridine pyrophosphokinase n=1 Tax=Malaciobacter molluscorum LMG 25693 TaxID=870501 RepID=A0A2G1DFB5_9BACT|nr:2-amino-4-hydroxy-6-hydroxymethyldihydropteridine diphosphokinase [Malaciobacter molluscorum]AXX91543.1 6-hydroxymethyl-7,8-dihydropterin pyrophosphokinase [Malaciobacter molluscorum LMG 25693]PHO17181.1 2-amino-4-hydroxy-6-hydroxymethyldihydropteridine diphosphokinase [Malaciobacter molluscorum LMG 25693]RXJ92760.1 2-amino-4-hydroxy-6-hydroxymethyldihydropteridine diphosphokinase [Malaciobacter molluscorum]
MRKKINNDLTLYYTNNFPYISKKESDKKHLVTIGIGGNIGNVKKRFDKLFLYLKADTRFDILITSPLLLNPPFGFLEQNDFLNGIIALKTNLAPNDFLKNMLRLEKRLGRKRSFQDAPRTLDIDIIFFDDKKINTKKLIIPHKDWANRESVIIPLKHL